MKRLLRTCLMPLTLLVVAAACETTLTRPEIDTLSYAHLPPLSFDVAQIEIVEVYQPTSLPPNVELAFPTPPSVALKRWVQDRIRAHGSANTLRITILDASAVRTALEANTDIEGVFTTEQAERIDARLSVKVEIIDAAGPTGTFAAAEAERSRTVPEGLTLDEREQVLAEITEALLNDYNASQEQSIRAHMSAYLR